MCVIHYWICVVCKHGFIRWTTECDEMHPPLIHCPDGYSWDYMYCDEEDCCMQRYHPYMPSYLVGQGDYTQYVDGKPTGLSSHTSHASTQTESPYLDQPGQTEDPAVTTVDALVSASKSLLLTEPRSKSSSNTSTQTRPTYQESHVQTDRRPGVMTDASTMTIPQDTSPTTTRRALSDSAPISPPPTPAIHAASAEWSEPSDNDTEYFTAKETLSDEEFTVVVNKRRKNKAKCKRSKRGGDGAKTARGA
jgi:hypothetical protein